MPDYISRQRLKKKVLDRWENEGGRLCADPKSSDPPDKRASEGNAAQTSKGLTAERNRRDDETQA